MVVKREGDQILKLFLTALGKPGEPSPRLCGLVASARISYNM